MYSYWKWMIVCVIWLKYGVDHRTRFSNFRKIFILHMYLYTKCIHFCSLSKFSQQIYRCSVTTCDYSVTNVIVYVNCDHNQISLIDYHHSFQDSSVFWCKLIWKKVDVPAWNRSIPLHHIVYNEDHGNT